MPARGLFQLPYAKGLPKLDDLGIAAKNDFKKPSIGVTQGGSSRRSRGAKVAATTAVFRQSKPTRT